ncbi:MAG: hypothetical protein KAH10_06590 [Flavobacteriales bacterium]|nr:hypothetical protein [Flavobacteriales bacterium]
MKNISLLLTLVISHTLYSQSYLGYSESNYSGLIGNRLNPSSVADNRVKFDLTVIGANFNIANNYYYFDIGSISATPPFISDDSELSNVDLENDEAIKMNLQTNIDIGLMFSINENIGIGIYIRPRILMSGDGLTSDFIEEIQRLSTTSNYSNSSISNQDMNITAMVWNEYTLNYGQVIINNKQHFLKVGIDLKLLHGLGTYYTKVDDLSYNYNSDSDVEFSNASGEIEVAYSDGFNTDDIFSKDGSQPFGFGFSFGAVYEWRPHWQDYQYATEDSNNNWRRDKSKYKLKVGFAVTDIGSLDYDLGKYSTKFKIINPSFGSNDIPSEGLEELHDFVNDPNNGIFKAEHLPSTRKVSLPTKINLSADYNIIRGFYVSALSSISVISSTNYLSLSDYTYYALIPRYESKFFDISIPLNYSDITGFNYGLSLRTGGFFIGTSDLSSIIQGEKIQGANVYFGIRVAFKHKSPKDMITEE